MSNQDIKKVLRRCGEELTGQLPVDEILGSLYSKEVITERDLSTIKSGSTVFDRREKLITILNTKPNEALDILIEILKKESAFRGVTKILEDCKQVFTELASIQPVSLSNSPKEAEVFLDLTPVQSVSITNLSIAMGENVSDQITTHRQLVAVANLISTDDTALDQIGTIAITFLPNTNQATDRHEIREMGNRSVPIYERIVKILELYKSRSKGSITLEMVADLLEKSGLEDLAVRVRNMTLPAP